ncbi:MAG: hypothetical protein KXJ61_11005 [Hydrogenophaga sp.]|jgi:hypothetical protein|uniref:hypothetical protein n=1 Tax=Hydrogenophaga sp. TaxID=1904254 RepID=UPI001D7C60FD|nr:hypothetical protein [Hydrogenophaga sp.]MBW0170743.1 hypothetical protein [Hydrogenophaga sp.]MBW0185599.1 hypothetical protein [Hydrogenophaga sp.]
MLAVGPLAVTRHLVDCHVLTLPRFPAAWVEEVRRDLDAEPVNQHWLAGIDGDLAAARARGFTAGCAPFVTSVDPDDRITPGTFAALLQALEDNPGAPFAWAGEQMVDEDLKPWRIRAHVWANGYEPILHVMKGVHVHGVKLYRREFVTPMLELMRAGGPCCEFLLDLAIVKPWTNPPRSHWPVHVPMVGRLWRQHRDNGFRDFKPSDFDRMAQVLGFASMNAVRDAVAQS